MFSTKKLVKNETFFGVYDFPFISSGGLKVNMK